MNAWMIRVVRLVISLVFLALLTAFGLRGTGWSQAYSFSTVARLGDPAPGGGNFTFDFEPSGINNRGEVAFVADLTVGGEGVFVGRSGQISQIARVGQSAPGDGIFAAVELGRGSTKLATWPLASPSSP